MICQFPIIEAYKKAILWSKPHDNIGINTLRGEDGCVFYKPLLLMTKVDLLDIS